MIPPLLHYISYKSTQGKKKNIEDLAGIIFSGIFMVVSTIFSAIALVENLK